MARGPIPYLVLKSNGDATPGASAQINVRGGGSATVYQNEVGGTTISNPVTTDSEGRIPGWLDEGSYDISISGAGITTVSRGVEILKGGGTLALADLSVTTAKVADLAITQQKLANGAVLLAKLETPVQQSLVPAGVMLPWAGVKTSPPAGYLICDGSAVSRATYSALFAAIDTAYGTGDGSTTFNLPDSRGKVLVSQTTVGTWLTRGSTGGVETVILTAAQSGLQDHTHVIDLDDTSHAVPSGAFYGVQGYSGGGTTSGVTGGAKSATTSHTNVQPYVTIGGHIIKT